MFACLCLVGAVVAGSGNPTWTPIMAVLAQRCWWPEECSWQALCSPVIHTQMATAPVGHIASFMAWPVAVGLLIGTARPVKSPGRVALTSAFWISHR